MMVFFVYIHHLCTYELAHLEMVAAIIYQLTKGLSTEEIKRAGLDTYFVDHTTGVYPIAASGVPMDMKYVGVKGDVIADLNEDLAAEQKARVTYDNILRLVDDPDVRDPIKYLRQRELVHYQRFGDAKRELSSKAPSKCFFSVALINTAYKLRTVRVDQSTIENFVGI